MEWEVFILGICILMCFDSVRAYFFANMSGLRRYPMVRGWIGRMHLRCQVQMNAGECWRLAWQAAWMTGNARTGVPLAWWVGRG